MNILKRIWARLQGWRTILINLGIALFFAFAEMLNYLAVVDWREILPPGWAPWVVIAVNIINIMLRHVTTKPSPTQALLGGKKNE